MKKQIVTACALIASVAAFATSVESSNTFGVLKVTGGAGKQIIIPVPWENVGGGDIVATNYVLSTGRSVGDKLYWYDNSVSAYKAWTIASENAPWTPATSYKIDGDISVTTPAEGTTIARGQSVILELASGSASTDVYVSGQYNSATTTSQIYGLESGEHAQFPLKFKSTMIAPPVASDYYPNVSATYGSTLSEGSVSGDVTMAGDKLSVVYPSGVTSNYTYYVNKSIKVGEETADRTGWFLKTPSEGYKAAVIPAGIGAWYMRYNDGNIYIKW